MHRNLWPLDDSYGPLIFTKFSFNFAKSHILSAILRKIEQSVQKLQFSQKKLKVFVKIL